MARRMKVYLPRWILWVILPVLFLIWLWITYLTFATPSGREEIGLVGWVILTVVFALIKLMVWLMGSGRLPAYEIESEDDSQE